MLDLGIKVTNINGCSYVALLTHKIQPYLKGLFNYTFKNKHCIYMDDITQMNSN